ncbi:hypothetical protein Tco_0462958 [Tanacetum coccineum]
MNEKDALRGSKKDDLFMKKCKGRRAKRKEVAGTGRKLLKAKKGRSICLGWSHREMMFCEEKQIPSGQGVLLLNVGIEGWNLKKRKSMALELESRCLKDCLRPVQTATDLGGWNNNHRKKMNTDANTDSFTESDGNHNDANPLKEVELPSDEPMV